MFAWRPFVSLFAVAGALVLAIAGPSDGAGPEERYVVRTGDTLWQLAAEHCDGDPREGVWQIRERNDLEGAVLPVGTILYLPAAAGDA